MYRSSNKAFTNIIQIIMDLVSIFVSFTIALMIVAQYSVLKYIEPQNHVWILIIYTPVFFMSMYILEMYHLATFNYRDRTLRNILISCLISTCFCLILSPYVLDYPHKLHVLGYFILVSAPIISLERVLSIQMIRKLRNKGKCRMILVGSPDRIKNYLHYIQKTSFQYQLLGHVLIGNAKEPIDQSQYLGELNDLEWILQKNVVDEVIFALPRTYMGEVERYLQLCEQRGLTVKLVLDLFDLQLAKTCMVSVGKMPVLTYHTVSLNNAQLLIKRIMDIAGSLLGIIFLSISAIFIVPAIKLDSKGKALFKQKRVGQNGRTFELYKFRSMCCDAEAQKKLLMEQNKIKDGFMFKIDKDPRVTKVGAFLRKTSLDELPQFINVLKGEMSLVGTRPPTVDEVGKYHNFHYRRISIKPGITGLWQISGRSEITDFDEVVRLDTAYIDNWSIWKDVEILFKTVWMLFFKNKGAYGYGSQEM